MSKHNIVSAWLPTTDSKELRVLGKALEETGELVNVLARCIIQGIDEIDPGSGKRNRERLLNEVADVMTQLLRVQEHYGLSEYAIEDRINFKTACMQEWDRLVDNPPPKPYNISPCASCDADENGHQRCSGRCLGDTSDLQKPAVDNRIAGGWGNVVVNSASVEAHGHSEVVETLRKACQELGAKMRKAFSRNQLQ